MEVDIDTLMTWARQHAPSEYMVAGRPVERRRVRLEIAAEPLTVESDGEYAESFTITRVMCRAFLAEPRCQHGKFAWLDDYHCECGPLAERRLG